RADDVSDQAEPVGVGVILRSEDIALTDLSLTGGGDMPAGNVAHIGDGDPAGCDRHQPAQPLDLQDKFAGDNIQVAWTHDHHRVDDDNFLPTLDSFQRHHFRHHLAVAVGKAAG